MLYLVVVLVVAIGVLIWAFRSIKPPTIKLCRSRNGPPVSSPRVRLRDGRFLAYKESGVTKENAKHKVIVTHGFNSSKDLDVHIPQKLLDGLDVYLLTYDRPGYGESDPNPKRSNKSDAFDIHELADHLQLGPKFHVVGLSIGTYSSWGCLKYIPHRLAGLAIVCPMISFWWPSLPPRLCNEAFYKFPMGDRLAFYIAHYAPKLYWVLQKWIPSSFMMPLDDFLKRCPHVYKQTDIKIFHKLSQDPNPNQHKVQQQGVYESLHRDVMVFYGKWEIYPTELKSPFLPNESCNVHLWQGYEDGMAPTELQRCVIEKLPWIKYHEVPDGGHLIFHDDACCEDILRTLLHA